MQVNQINSTNFSGIKGKQTLKKFLKDGSTAHVQIFKDNSGARIKGLECLVEKNNSIQSGYGTFNTKGLNKNEVAGFFEKLGTATKGEMDALINFAKGICIK